MASTKPQPKPAEQASKAQPSAKAKDKDTAIEDSKHDTTVRDLIHFFKKTPPPSTNYMSIPDETSSSDEDTNRWQRFKRRILWRRKTPKHRPPVIMLPDSAVSARTTDGHRYIAISIPTEYSHLAPLPCTQYPVYDSIEAAFHREINSRFGMWKNPPSNRVVAVLNPVEEEQKRGKTGPLGRVRPRSVSHTPTQQQRYVPGSGRAKGLGKTKSLGHAARPSHLSDAPPLPTQGEGMTSMAWPDSQDVLLQATQANPIITLTLPSRKSSKRMTRPAPETSDDGRKSSDATSGNEGDESAVGSGGSSSGIPGARDSFAASIITTNSSPAPVLRAQTAKAYHSVPIVVRSGGSSLKPPKGETGDSSKGVQSDVKRSDSKKQKSQAKEKDTESGDSEETDDAKEGTGKGKEPSQRAFPLVPRPPSSSYSSSGPKSTGSSQQEASASSDRAEREARYISKALAAEQESLEKLPRKELIRRYESLREQSIYDREKRLRRLERNRDAWARVIPDLFQEFNGLLREQHRLLEGAVVSPGGTRRQGRPRAHSADTLGTHRSLEPLEVKPSVSSSESHPSYMSSKSQQGKE